MLIFALKDALELMVQRGLTFREAQYVILQKQSSAETVLQNKKTRCLLAHAAPVQSRRLGSTSPSLRCSAERSSTFTCP